MCMEEERVRAIKLCRSLDMMPNSRLGLGWLVRKQFQKARNMKERQDEWCQRAKKMASIDSLNAHRHVSEHFPEDLETELVVSLLRGKTKLNNHCYTVRRLESYSDRKRPMIWK
jgi:hypothetical protein